MRRLLVLALLAVAGCANYNPGPQPNPEMDVLAPGTQAVTTVSEYDLEYRKSNNINSPLSIRMELDGWEDAFEKASANFNANGKTFGNEMEKYSKQLPPGIRVTIGYDPGYFEWTQKAKEHELFVSSLPEDKKIFDSLTREATGKKYPPHWRSSGRLVSVVVETGEHRGVAGKIHRRRLHPIK